MLRASSDLVLANASQKNVGDVKKIDQLMLQMCNFKSTLENIRMMGEVTFT